MISAKTGALTIPTVRWPRSVPSTKRVRNIAGEMPSSSQDISAPPSRPETLAISPRIGSVTSSARMRGTNSTVAGSRPRVRIASISSRIFIEPMAAVKAEAVRPATMIAVSRMPSSRRIDTAIRSTTKTSAPNCRNCEAPWKASTIPMRKAISATMGTAFSPTSSQ